MSMSPQGTAQPTSLQGPLRSPLPVGSNPAGSPGKGGAIQPQPAGVPAASALYANPQQQAQNVFQQSATNMNDASNRTATAGNMYHSVYQAPANTAQYGGDISQSMSQYMNPYTRNVIDRTAADMNRQTQVQLNNVGAEAALSGAFGGSRHGLVEATTNSEAQRALGDFSANMRNQGWNTAAALSQADADRLQQSNQFNAGQMEAMRQRQLAAAGGYMGAAGQQAGIGGQQFDMGTAIGDRQFQQGEFARQLQQQVMTGANNQFNTTTGQPQQLLSTLMQAIGLSPLNNATTTTGRSTPGLFDYLSLGLQTFGAGR